MAAAMRNVPASPVASPAFDCSTSSPLETAAAVSHASSSSSSKPAAAGDSASTNWADILGEISESDEDDWYLQDVKVWMSRT
eukprot:1469821-Heterocapsa_arctica.AAC.1